MVEVKNITKLYGKLAAVDGLSFTVESGQVYGLLGPNGAGKTTTMNIMTGCLAATEGTVVIDGCDIFESPVEAKKKIGYLPEIPPLYTDMTAREYLSFVGEAKGLGGEQLRNAMDKVCELSGITEVKNRLIKNLSKGYRQRVGIAAAIIGDPQVIILDEPTVGLDPVQIIEIRELIRSLAEKHTVILSSHILSEVSEVCDEILIISEGRLVANDTTENLARLLDSGEVIVVEAKGAPDSIRQTLEELDCVKSVTVAGIKPDGAITVNVTAKEGVDAREAIFYAMKSSENALLAMNIKKTSLEEVFLKIVSKDIPKELQKKLSGMKNSMFKNISTGEEAQEQ